jgi:hypothetical protein
MAEARGAIDGGRFNEFSGDFNMEGFIEKRSEYHRSDQRHERRGLV